MKSRRYLVALVGALCALTAAVPAAAQRDEPLPRFEDPVCPGIVGLKIEPAEEMVGRIRSIAEDVGLRLAKNSAEDTAAEGCDPNIIVAFVEDGEAFLNRLRQNRPELFVSLSAQDRRELLADPGPVHVLTSVRARTRDGMTIPRRDNLVQVPQTGMWSAHSKIYTATRNDITAALVLIDRGAINGLSIEQLADYAAMRALTKALPTGYAPGSSILDLFEADPADRPGRLSSLDETFLKNLYRGIPNLPGSARLAEMNKHSKNKSNETE